MISNSRKSIAALADDIMALSQHGNTWSQAAESLQFMREFEKHSDNPSAFEELVDALEERGGSLVELIRLPLAELAFIPLVVMRQHAVGHGGFHTGVMGRGKARLRWVYDCGALRTKGQKQLSDEIKYLASEYDEEKVRLDLLFISHFDRDHVSGIKELMSTTEVDTVIIPYLDDIQRAIALVDDMSKRDNMDEDTYARFTEVIFNPITWLTELGARRVMQIRPGEPGLDSSRIIRYGPGDGPEISDRVGRVQPVLVRQNDDDTAAAAADDRDIVDSGSGWMVTHFGRQFGDWCFLPYVTQTGQSVRDAFKTAFGELLDLQTDETLVDAFRRKMGEDGFAAKVKIAYKEHELGDANATSMSLYVGPFRDGVSCHRTSLRAGQKWAEAGPGWLLTGDAKLAQVGRRKQWQKFYAPLKSRIGALMLPHHGSHLNFHEGILDVVEKDCLLFVCRTSKKSGDPLHENVWSVVEDRSVAIVSDDPESSLLQVSGATVLDSAEHVLSDLAVEWR